MSGLLARLLPVRPGNEFPGNRVALWAFYGLTALTLWRSLHHILAPDGGAQSVATIPLDQYDPAAAATVIAMFALWGLSQLLTALVMLLACVRYKSLIPLLWLLVLAEYAGRWLVLHAKPIVTIGTAPGVIGNQVLPFVALIMLILSLRPPSHGGS
ncbi:hypothetical protein [Sandarakinorhabdus oryzae]|uniref:hypothetical protein n=1 Tax=Sandarakinorhabdus oryzae TaxID=2675220 RepID=UPI0012E24A48|nr:hypothetical protein [Sandarakinorhabdus oryzae]